MARSIKLVIPGQAASKNNFKMYSKGWREKWKRIKAFEREVADAAIAAGAKQVRRKHKGPVYVHTVAYRQKCDPSNIERGVLDALEGICYDNDKDARNSAEPASDKGKARVEITITFS